MKKIYKKMIVLFMMFIIADVSIGYFLDQVLIYSPDGRYKKAETGLNECEAEIIIFGSSRAEENYSPLVLEDTLNMTCWNAGRGGQSLPYWYAMSMGILKRHTPEIVIINIDTYFLSLDLTDAYQRTGLLRPFYHKNPEIKPVLNKISPFERIFNYSKLYSYNSSFYYLFRPYVFRGIDGRPEDKGWRPRIGYLGKNGDSPLIVDSRDPLNQEAVELFEEFIDEFTERGIKVFLVVSPDYNHVYKSTATMEYVSAMQDVTYINLGDDLLFATNHQYYTDPTHLNMEGAIEFSGRLSSEIKRHTTRARYYAKTPSAQYAGE